MGKCKVTEICGVFYYEEMTEEEFDKKFDQMVWKVDNVHT